MIEEKKTNFVLLYMYLMMVSRSQCFYIQRSPIIAEDCVHRAYNCHQKHVWPADYCKSQSSINFPLPDCLASGLHEMVWDSVVFVNWHNLEHVKVWRFRLLDEKLGTLNELISFQAEKVDECWNRPDSDWSQIMWWLQIRPPVKISRWGLIELGHLGEYY